VTLVMQMMLEDTRTRRARTGERRHRDELQQLLVTLTPSAWQRVLADALPAVSIALFASCLGALSSGSHARCVLLARRLRRQLRSARISDRRSPGVWPRLVLRVLCRQRRSPKQPARGGRVIAFVGGDGAGKSTLVAATRAWLSPLFDVRTFHLGKPPLGIGARAAIAAARRVGLGDAASALVLGYARRRLTRRAHRLARSGAVVITDRYPSMTAGAMDSPRLALEMPGHGIQAALAAFEWRVYRDMPPPDLVLRVTVPLGVAQERLRNRGTLAGADVVGDRHAPAAEPRFPAATVFDLDGSLPLERVCGAVQGIVWNAL
jgi:thymidylate kinase